MISLYKYIRVIYSFISYSYNFYLLLFLSCVYITRKNVKQYILSKSMSLTDLLAHNIFFKNTVQFRCCICALYFLLEYKDKISYQRFVLWFVQSRGYKYSRAIYFCHFLKIDFNSVGVFKLCCFH